MIFDKQAVFSEDQAVTVTAASTNVINLGDDDAAVQALNSKGDLEVFAAVTTAFADGTSLKVGLQSDDDEAFGSPTTVVESAAIGVATLKAGYRFKIPKLPRINEQYVRLYYTVVGTMSAGKIMAGLILDGQTNGA
jgi:outer membrane receptor for ferrienterochelin and colicin